MRCSPARNPATGSMLVRRYVIYVEVYYGGPTDSLREARIIDEVFKLGGQLDCQGPSNGMTGNCLTFDFADEQTAQQAAVYIIQQVRTLKVHTTTGTSLPLLFRPIRARLRQYFR